MPDKDILKFWPWVAGVFGLFGVALRNEVKTNKVEKAVFNNDGDLRLVRLDMCQACQATCQARRDQERKEFREDIQGLHAKLDMVLLRLPKE